MPLWLCLSFCLCLCLCSYLSVCPSVCLSVCLSLSLTFSVSVSVYLVCVAKISAATIYITVGVDSCSFGFLTRFQDCCLCVVALSLSIATANVNLRRDVDTFEFSVYLGTPCNAEENNNSRSKTNFSLQFLAIYVCYTQFNGVVKNTTTHVVRCSFHNIIKMLTVKKNPREIGF